VADPLRGARNGNEAGKKSHVVPRPATLNGEAAKHLTNRIFLIIRLIVYVLF
jgi:hypothetical protein